MYVSNMHRGKLMKSLKHNHENYIDNVLLLHKEPMQLMKDWSDMVMFLWSDNQNSVPTVIFVEESVADHKVGNYSRQSWR